MDEKTQSKSTPVNCLVSDLAGEWRVTALGIASPMNLLGDKKRIDGTAGFNLISDKQWGFFTIDSEEDMIIVLNYDDPRNNPLLRCVRDRIVKIGDGWIGTLFLNGNALFNFRLDR